MKTQKESLQDESLPVLDGQLTLDDILSNVDDGTYGKPIDEFVVEANKELRL